MTIVTGGPEHLYVDQVPAPGPWQTGFDDGMAGKEPAPHDLYDHADRASYHQGHIRGGIARRAERSRSRRNFTPRRGTI